MSQNQEGYKVPETPLVLNPNYKPESQPSTVTPAHGHSDDVAHSPTDYTVQKNDTLSAIAKKFLGNANRYPEIFQLNKDILKDPDHIMPGQVLKIPASESKLS